MPRTNPYQHHYYLDTDEYGAPVERANEAPGAPQVLARIPNLAFVHVAGNRAIVSSVNPVGRPGWQRLEPHYYWAPVYIDPDHGHIRPGQLDGLDVVDWEDVGLTRCYLEREDPLPGETQGRPLRFLVRSLEPLDVPGWEATDDSELDQHPGISTAERARLRRVFVPDFEERRRKLEQRSAALARVASIDLGAT